MSHEDEQMLRFGREMYRMATDVLNTPPGAQAYARRKITTRGASFEVFIVKTTEHADLAEAVFTGEYFVTGLKAADPDVKN